MKTFTLGLVLLASPALATTMIALDVTALSRSADSIVQGTVARVEPKLSKDGSRITTHVFLDVKESLKGTQGPTSTVEIVQQGGIVGDMGQKVSGTANLKAGDEIFVFLEPRGPTRFMLVGMAQGCFRIERSSDGSTAFAVQDPAGDVLLLDPVTHAQVSKGTEPMRLDALKSKVRAALAPPGVAEPQPGPGTRPVVEPGKAVK